ncbi:PIH1 domain-containing protein 2 isoform X2 [Tiliqua scincoides]|uniref:PIH1 domain-containing protein 2 isoform X2 n=1 Tax=Tiliqua scincoides TaxID=71010 RepID=UPI003461F8BE
MPRSTTRLPSHTSASRPTSWWNKVPAPQSPSDPIPLKSDKIEEVSDKSELYSVLNIAYNPSVLERVKDHPAEEDQLIRLSLKYIKEHFKVTLSHSYSITKFKLKGSLERMRQSLRGGPAPAVLSKKNTKKEMTLDQLRNITPKEDSSDLTLLTENSVPTKACLIEEISSTQAPELRTPPYELSVRKSADGRPLKIELKVELPEVGCISDCNLSVSKDDVLIEYPEKYRLHLDLPEPVSEEETTAAFYKKKGILHITIPIWQQK